MQSLKSNTTLFCKQAVYKQLAPGWQIAKQLSGLNPFELSNNRIKCKIAAKPTIHQNSAVSKALLGQF